MDLENPDIRKAREEFHASQAELARALGVSQPFISQVEAGDRPLPESRLADFRLWVNELSEKRERDLVVMRECLERVTDEEVMEELARMRA